MPKAPYKYRRTVSMSAQHYIALHRIAETRGEAKAAIVETLIRQYAVAIGAEWPTREDAIASLKERKSRPQIFTTGRLKGKAEAGGFSIVAGVVDP